jgi:hypothetical protein
MFTQLLLLFMCNNEPLIAALQFYKFLDRNITHLNPVVSYMDPTANTLPYKLLHFHSIRIDILSILQKTLT